MLNQERFDELATGLATNRLPRGQVLKGLGDVLFLSSCRSMGGTCNRGEVIASTHEGRGWKKMKRLAIKASRRWILLLSPASKKPNLLELLQDQIIQEFPKK